MGVRKKFQEYYPDDSLEFPPEIQPRNGEEATKMAKELGATVVLLGGFEPIPMHGIRSGEVRYVLENEEGELVELEYSPPKTKPFVP